MPQEQTPIQVSDRTNRLVEQSMPDAFEQVRAESKHLIETVTRKAQSEAQKAGELALDNYLEAVRRARQEIESTELFDPERIEQSFQLLGSRWCRSSTSSAIASTRQPALLGKL